MLRVSILNKDIITQFFSFFFFFTERNSLFFFFFNANILFSTLGK